MGTEHTVVTEPGQPDIRVVDAEDELEALAVADLPDGSTGSVEAGMPIGYGAQEPDEDGEG